MKHDWGLYVMITEHTKNKISFIIGAGKMKSVNLALLEATIKMNFFVPQ
ncbi:hypothetical protein [Arenibacter latericius]|nr:hypothetical protein [Arenibacter latericius]